MERYTTITLSPNNFIYLNIKCKVRPKTFSFRNNCALQLGANTVKKKQMINDVGHFKILPEGTLF